MLVVAKFGGSSLANAAQFQKVKKIVLAKSTRQIVVVSAMGKSKPDDTKMTDLLFLLHAHIMYSIPFDNIFNIIKERFVSLKQDLNLKYNIEEQLEALRLSFSKTTSIDMLVSRGEYFTAQLMAEYLDYEFLDAVDLIKFNYNGTINNELTEKNIRMACKEGHKYLIPGFYGSYPNGEIKLLARGGSDITGSLVAKAVNASLYENWTDVSGILIADPRIVSKPKRITEITYDELRELAYMGANVLHEETVFPVQELNIPINILNTNDQNNPGTIITENCQETKQIITGISGKKNYMSFTVTKTTGCNKTMLIRKVLELFERFNVNVEHIPSSIDRFSVIVNADETKKVMFDILAEIKQNEAVKNVVIDYDLALIAVVGRNMANHAGISGKIFNLVGEKGINIKMIAQDTYELAIIFGVANQDMEETIKEIYAKMIN